MILNLRIEWPSTSKRQIIVSQRDSNDPYGNSGFYVAMQGDSLVIGTGQHGSNEVSIHNAMPAKASLEINPNCLTWAWGNEANETIGLMFFTPLGDVLYVGEDPQMPYAKWSGSVELIKE